MRRVALIVVDHYPLSPRVLKVKTSIETQNNIKVYIYVWNRNNKIITEDFVYGYSEDIGYGNFLLSVKHMNNFFKATNRFIDELQPDFLHIVDYSMLRLLNNNHRDFNVIYEVYDIKFFKNKFIDVYRYYSEKLKIKKYVSSIILSSPYFKDYYVQKMNYNGDIAVLNNKPTLDFLNKQNQYEILDKYRNVIENKKVISFIGTVRYRDILLNLIKAVEALEDTIILIAGDGPDLGILKEYTLNKNVEDKVLFTGRYKTSEIRDIYSITDFVWAAYPNEDINVKLAISNKYFEAQLYQVPIIISNDTKLSNDLDGNIGVSTDPYNSDKIRETIKNLDKKNFYQKKINLESILWENEQHVLNDIYNDGDIL